jgi:hypothetical protein
VYHAARRLLAGLLCVLALAAAAGPAPAPVAAEGGLGTPRVTQLGTFGGVAYVQYDGLFEGQTSTGTYRVPYRISAPADPLRANRAVLVEPSHFAAGLGALELNLGRDFLFARRFAHAGIGWSTGSPPPPLGGTGRILDPTAAGVFINGGVPDGGGRTDDEIIADFARALAVDATAQRLLGRVERRYLTGFSDTSDPVLRLVTSGRAAGVVDFALPFTAAGHDPQAALAAGRYRGKLIVVNSEFEGASTSFVDRGGAPQQYRFYAVAGTPHIPDFLVPSFTSRSTPASFQPALRAHFLQGHDWVRGGLPPGSEEDRVRAGPPPPPSTHLKTTAGGTLERDGNGNALTVDASGQPVPRLPVVELGEARYIAGFVGHYDAVKSITALDFASHAAYLRAFERALADYAQAGYILKEDADAMGRRAALCPPLTFTETYRDHYEAFVARTSCSG